ERSKATFSTPAALAFSAITRPTLAAASAFLPFFRPSLTSDWTVEAEARTFEPSALKTCAYRCWPVRSTDRRGTPSSRMCARVDLARRRRAGFLFMLWSPKAESRLGLLGFLADDVLAGVLHALALVGLRRTEAANLGGDFADALLVGARHDDFRLRRGGDGDAFRGREQHRVRETQREVQVLALHRGTVTDADQLELALEAVGDALDHVREDGTERTGHRDERGVVGGEQRIAVFNLDVHAGRLGDRQGALRALDRHVLGLDVEFDALTQGDRLLGDAGHVSLLP